MDAYNSASSPSVYDDDYDFQSAAHPKPRTPDPYSDSYYEQFVLNESPKVRPIDQYHPGDSKRPQRRKWNVSRTPTPVPLLPSDEYLSQSLQPSETISDPATSRKLLILDLNGTLLLRAPHVPPPKRGRGRQPHYNPYADPTALRPLRKVHLRPYMCCFREFLFHEKTKTWLDTMVWSSAQPHSVQDMIGWSFVDHKDELLGVWARDTLGLAEDEYNRKVQTTKDLAKPWNAIRSINGNSCLLDQSEPETDLPAVHSLHTTLLVDDSPLKVQLQPWNHVCVPEYLAQTRKKDLRVLQYEEHRAQDAHKSDYTPTPADAENETALSSRKLRKLRRKQARQLEKEKQKAAYFATFPEEDTRFDETLLAVIGVLDTLKKESSVAGWIRAKGLWAGHDPLKTHSVDSSSDQSDSTSDELESSDEDTQRAGKLRRLKIDSDVTSSAPDPPPSHADTRKDELGLEQHWFENRAILNHWVSRGRKALEVLQIPISSGIVE